MYNQCPCLFPGGALFNHSLDREVLMVTNGGIVDMNAEDRTDRISLTLPQETPQ
jgi:hypothetical protein